MGVSPSFTSTWRRKILQKHFCNFALRRKISQKHFQKICFSCTNKPSAAELHCSTFFGQMSTNHTEFSSFLKIYLQFFFNAFFSQHVSLKTVQMLASLIVQVCNLLKFKVWLFKTSCNRFGKWLHILPGFLLHSSQTCSQHLGIVISNNSHHQKVRLSLSLFLLETDRFLNFSDFNSE